MVGHTHENIDQMFSCFSRVLDTTNFITPQEIKTMWETAFTSKSGIPVTVLPHLYQTNYRAWVAPFESELRDTSFALCYLFERGGTGEVSVLYECNGIFVCNIMCLECKNYINENI